MNFKKNILLALLWLSGVTALQAQSTSLKLVNPLKQQRPDELIVLKREFLEKKFKKIIDGKIAITEVNQPIIVQFDDVNADGIWDEIAFLQDFKALEKKKLLLSFETASSVKIKPLIRAYVRQKRKTPDNTFGLN